MLVVVNSFFSFRTSQRQQKGRRRKDEKKQEKKNAVFVNENKTVTIQARSSPVQRLPSFAPLAVMKTPSTSSHNNAIVIPTLLHFPHELTSTPTCLLSLQVDDENTSVVRVEDGGETLALHEGGDGGFDFGDVGGGVVACVSVRRGRLSVHCSLRRWRKKEGRKETKGWEGQTHLFQR